MAEQDEFSSQANSAFDAFSKQVVSTLSPVEQMSPFRIGQIQKLVADSNEELGLKTAPCFAITQVFFLLGFVGYFVAGLVALVLDAAAMDEECAAESWIWLYVLLVLVIPTSLGFVIGLVQGAMQMVFTDATALRNIDLLLGLPSPLINVTLGVLGLALWGGMDSDCATFYWENYAMLLVIFYIQIGLMCISALFGTITLCLMGIGLINSATRLASKYSALNDAPASSASTSGHDGEASAKDA